MSIDHTSNIASTLKTDRDRYMELYDEVLERWSGHWWAIVGGRLFHDAEASVVDAALREIGVEPFDVLVSYMPEQRPFWVL